MYNIYFNVKSKYRVQKHLCRRAQKEDIALIVSSISKTDHETITNNGMRQLELNNDARVITPSIFYYTYTLLIEYLENDREKRPSIRLASLEL